MPKKTEAEQILDQARNIDKKDVKAYLDMRQSLSERIKEMFEMIQCHALGISYKGREVGKEEASNLKWLVKFYMDELRDDSAMRSIKDEHTQKLEEKGKRTSPSKGSEEDHGLGQVVTFSKKARHNK